ncbi:uncharacterized protein LOC119433006 [Dermacentor silvarum]|uniref:uncharacterized protein LOC119433006 n=1 Tax=Dermacentor silvarum TaxID=543639 RepID=UPI00189B2AB1|nr:uncharacterized protein LOC119433006 [Dermacentor silvarum]
MSSATSSETYLHSHSITHTWTVHNCGKLRLRNKVSLCSSPFPAQWDEPRFQIWLTTDVDYYGYETASCFIETKSTLQGSYSLALRDPTGRDIAQVTCNTKTAARITCEKKCLVGLTLSGSSNSNASVASAACSGDDNDRYALVVLFRFEYMTDRSGGQDECPGSPLLGQLPGPAGELHFRRRRDTRRPEETARPRRPAGPAVARVRCHAHRRHHRGRQPRRGHRGPVLRGRPTAARVPLRRHAQRN